MRSLFRLPHLADFIGLLLILLGVSHAHAAERPNILLAISDDQSFYHTSKAGPSLTYLVDHVKDPAIRKYLDLAVAKRPVEELFAVNADPDCLKNLAADPAFAEIKAELAAKLDAQLTTTGDPRVAGDGEIFETYPRYSEHRKFPEPRD